MTASRRNVLLGGAAVAVLAAAGGAYEARHLIGRHYSPTPYDDLLDRLEDREAAKRVGVVFLKDHKNFTAAKAAEALRRQIGQRSLAETLQDEIAQGRLTEAAHWAMPQTLAGLCALAASV
jgi:hypothetical protein